MDFQKLLPGTINLPGVFAILWGHFGEGSGAQGEGPVLDPLLAGNYANTIRQQLLNRLGSHLFAGIYKTY